jgi:hypothetical protein
MASLTRQQIESLKAESNGLYQQQQTLMDTIKQLEEQRSVLWRQVSDLEHKLGTCFWLEFSELDTNTSKDFSSKDNALARNLFYHINQQLRLAPPLLEIRCPDDLQSTLQDCHAKHFRNDPTYHFVVNLVSKTEPALVFRVQCRRSYCTRHPELHTFDDDSYEATVTRVPEPDPAVPIVEFSMDHT